MTKTELITKLNAKFSEVAPEADWINEKTYMGYDLIRISVMESNGSFKSQNDVSVWKKNTTYYWYNAEPKATSFKFGEDINTYIQAKINDGTIEAAFLESIDKKNEKAIGSVVIDEGGLVQKRLLIDRNTSGNLQYRVIS